MVRKHIPNFITSLNVLCGSIAVVLILWGMLTMAVLFIILAAVFDFFDGMTARLLKSYSPLGKELDSLADMVSFGLAPGLILFKLLERSLQVGPLPGSPLSLSQMAILGSAFLIPVFSALRLAKFNVDERQTTSFIGLPTPANALFISSLGLISEHGTLPGLDQIVLSIPFLVAVAFLFSWLLVAEVPMFSLKMKSFRWAPNKVQFIFLFLSLCLLLSLHIYGIMASILLFIAISLFRMLAGNSKK
ncbi:MAG: CDP-diacylglycerol--serine O-phosphatidyltransferase [Marinilabiliales bacterium]|nr:CDP-diacylglycerol--serine O-phosphatidyltransferase [Marinilabiliales bacterium]